MKTVRPRAILERGAASDLWRNTLSQIPSVYGRLVYLTGLRDSNSGRYEHHGLALIFGEKDANDALRKSHRASFEEWLSFTLEQQKADLDLYLSDLFSIKRTVVENWLRLAPYKNLAPAGAGAAERALFLADFETLLQLLKSESGAASPDPEA